MRIRSLFFSMFAGLVLAGCSSEEDITSGNNGGESGEPQFLTINLVTNSTGSPLAAKAKAPGDDNATFEEGLEPENKVTKVRFYFFDASGNAAHVRNEGGQFKNYLEWTDVLEENNQMPNVEKILSATLIIQSPKGDAAPAQVVAVVNPTVNPNEERSLTSLATVAYDYQAYTESGSFVMSNSAYADNGAEKMAVSVVGKIHKTSGEALNDPVEIYVERTIAKVRLNSSLTPIEGKTNIFKTSEDGSQKVTVGGTETEIYVKFLGWNTTAVSNKSRLVKDINPSWPGNLLGTTPWNWAENFRSFWAVNASGVTYRYGAFVPDPESKPIDGNLFQAQAKTAFDKSQWVYVNENATDYANAQEGAAPGTPTKVIISAQLVDADGNALEFAEYGSTRTTIEGLKELFANNCGLYKKETLNGATKFTKIKPEELTVKTATAVGEAGKDVVGRYKAYVQLAEDEDKDGKWYASNNEDAAPITAATANKQLKGLGSAKVWKDGYTYYYFDISHFGNKKGVVRNHIYDANITNLTGLGTPVYDPEEIIYPEKPKDDNDTFIAAQIKILSWRVVNSDVTLDW